MKKNTKGSFLSHENEYLGEQNTKEYYSKYDYTPYPSSAQNPITMSSITNNDLTSYNDEEEDIFNDDLFQKFDNKNNEK